MECKVWSGGCRVWSVKVRVWSVKCKVWSVKCGQNAVFGVLIMDSLVVFG